MTQAVKTETVELTNLLKLSPGALNALMDELDRMSEAGVVSARPGKRQFARFQLRPARPARLDLEIPGSPLASYMVYARNVSSRGMSIIHGVYVHAGTRCVLRIRDGSGVQHELSGEVKRCSHVQGRAHELGLRFDQPVSPRMFLEERPADPASPARPQFDPKGLVQLAVQLAENAKAGVPRDELAVIVDSLVKLVA